MCKYNLVMTTFDDLPLCIRLKMFTYICKYLDPIDARIMICLCKKHWKTPIHYSPFRLDIDRSATFRSMFPRIGVNFPSSDFELVSLTLLRPNSNDAMFVWFYGIATKTGDPYDESFVFTTVGYEDGIEIVDSFVWDKHNTWHLSISNYRQTYYDHELRYHNVH
jgi:hypothetical protein